MKNSQSLFISKNTLFIFMLLFFLFPASAKAHSKLDGIELLQIEPCFFINIGIFTFAGIIKNILKREKVNWLRRFIKSLIVLAITLVFSLLYMYYEYLPGDLGDIIGGFGISVLLYLPVFLLNLLIIAIISHVTKKRDRIMAIGSDAPAPPPPTMCCADKSYRRFGLKSLIILLLFFLVEVSNFSVYDFGSYTFWRRSIIWPLLGLYLPVLLIDLIMLLMDKKRAEKLPGHLTP